MNASSLVWTPSGRRQGALGVVSGVFLCKDLFLCVTDRSFDSHALCKSCASSCSLNSTRQRSRACGGGEALRQGLREQRRAGHTPQRTLQGRPGMPAFLPYLPLGAGLLPTRHTLVSFALPLLSYLTCPPCPSVSSGVTAPHTCIHQHPCPTSRNPLIFSLYILV